MATAKHEQWRRHVAAWAASGLTCDEYAQRSGVNRHTLVWWKRRLKRDVRVTAMARPASTSFVEVLPAVLEAAGMVHVGDARRERIELEVGGIVVRVPDVFESKTLSQVLAVLR